MPGQLPANSLQDRLKGSPQCCLGEQVKGMPARKKHKGHQKKGRVTLDQGPLERLAK